MGRRRVAAGMVAMWCTICVPAAAAQERTEVRVASGADDARLVASSYVSLLAPAPRDFGPRPPACDRIGYLRLRSAKGPADFRDADAILVGMPGLTGGGTLMDRIGRNAIRRAEAMGRHIEFWSLDRRSNCLEDHRGLLAARRTGDPLLAAQYYFKGRAIDGHRYAGQPDAAGKAFLSHIGLAQTLRDMMAVIAQVPAQDRARKVLCGGHSLGSRLAGAFAKWDFDGDPATTADAGYRQCAALFSIDQRLREETSLEALTAAFPALGLTTATGPLGAAPYADTLADPLLALGVATVAAQVAPDAESRLAEQLPRDGTIELLLRALLSPDAASFAAGSRQLRDFRLTNLGVFGAIYDDNSQGLGLLKVSLGTFAGGPVNHRDFPTPTGTPNLDGLAGGNALVAPARTRAEGGPLYGWTPFDAITDGSAAIRDSDGNEYTRSASEVTDIRDFTRLAAESPVDFWEWYFPTRIATEAIAETAGDRSGDLANARYDGVSRLPALYIDAGEGIERSGTTPSGGPGTRRVVLAGYNHIDPSTASYQQPGGRPEIGSLELARFTASTAPAPTRPRVCAHGSRVVRVRVRRRDRVRRVVATVGRQHVGTSRTRRVRIRFAGLQAGRVTVRLTIRVRRAGKARRVEQRRVVRTCRA